MKKLLFAAAISTLGLASAAQASGCGSPYCNGGGFFGGRGGHGLPAFQAAPWYLYWPYNSHFMTPAPMGGYGHYGPASAPGGGLINPYFPAAGGPTGGYSYPSAPPAQMPGAIPPSSSVPPNPTPPAPMPLPTTPPAGATPAVTPGVSIPVVPGIIRTSARR